MTTRQTLSIPELSRRARLAHKSGDLSTSLKYYSSALVQLNRKGQTELALNLGNEALQRFPKDAFLHNILGLLLQQKLKFEESLLFFDKAIALNKNFPAAYNNKGNILLSMGKPSLSVECFEKAIALDNKSCESYCNLGIALHQLQQLDEALINCKKATSLKPDYCKAHSSTGAILIDLKRPAEAIDSFNKALQLNDNYVPALANKASALLSIGNIEQASEFFLKTINAQPGNAEAYRHLSTIRKFDRNDPLLNQMINIYKSSSNRRRDLKNVSLALAKAYDDIGDFDTSFKYLSEGNALRREELKYDIGPHKKLVSQLKSIFSGNNGNDKSLTVTDKTPKPIFILGMPRSGSSLVEQILASHTEIHGAGELSTLGNAVNELLYKKYSNKSSDDLSRALQSEGFQHIRNCYFDSLASMQINKNVITDKMPGNFLLIGFIVNSFPEAKIIHTKRNAIATCWSVYKHYFRGMGHPYSYDLKDLTAYFKLYRDIMAFWKDKFPGRIYELNYEALTENQVSETRALLDYCELEWQDNCLDFHKTDRVVSTSSATQVRKKMYQGSSDAWKNYSQHLDILVQELAD